jgi:hypothetical protein
MAITPSQASQYIGRPVCAHCYGRKYYGVLQRVTNQGIYMQQMGGAAVNGSKEEASISTADRPEGVDAENVFFPLLFLPFLALTALTPWWGWGGYWW